MKVPRKSTGGGRKDVRVEQGSRMRLRVGEVVVA